MLPVLQIGPLALQLPGLMLLLGLWMGLSLAEKFSIKRNYPADDLYNLVFITLISAVIGARLGFALQNLEAFRVSPLILFRLTRACSTLRADSRQRWPPVCSTVSGKSSHSGPRSTR